MYWFKQCKFKDTGMCILSVYMHLVGDIKGPRPNGFGSVFTPWTVLCRTKNPVVKPRLSSLQPPLVHYTSWNLVLGSNIEQRKSKEEVYIYIYIYIFIYMWG